MKNCDDQVMKYQRKMVKLSDDQRLDIKDKADTNRNRLKRGLAEDEKPTPIGMHTQGSYSMKTMIQEEDGDYDIDDGIYFKKEDLVGSNGGEMTALAVRKMVCKALQDNRFTKDPEVRENCARVYYNEGYHVDVPSYRKIETEDPVTEEKKIAWELAGSDWKRSDARSVTRWFKTANNTLCSDSSNNGNSGQFVRMTRLLKKFAKSRASWKSRTISGFAISCLVKERYQEIKERDDEAFRQLMQKIYNRLEYNDEIGHPTLSDENIVDTGSRKVSFFRECLGGNLEHLIVLDEPKCTHEQAMKAWDKVFKTDWFENQQDPDVEKKIDARTTAPVIKNGDTRYASENRQFT